MVTRTPWLPLPATPFVIVASLRHRDMIGAATTTTTTTTSKGARYERAKRQGVRPRKCRTSSVQRFIADPWAPTNRNSARQIGRRKLDLLALFHAAPLLVRDRFSTCSSCPFCRCACDTSRRLGLISNAPPRRPPARLARETSQVQEPPHSLTARCDNTSKTSEIPPSRPSIFYRSISVLRLPPPF